MNEGVHGDGRAHHDHFRPHAHFCAARQGRDQRASPAQIEPDLREYYANLRDAIDGKAEPIVKTSQVRSVVRVLEAAFESAKTGKTDSAIAR